MIKMEFNMNKRQIKFLSHMVKEKGHYSMDGINPMDCDAAQKLGVELNLGSLTTYHPDSSPNGFRLTPLGQEMSELSEKEIYKSIELAVRERRTINLEKSFSDHLFSWYGILGTTITIIGFWAFGWQVWGWWFFGLVS